MRREELADEEHHLLAAILETAVDGIVVIDEQGTIERVNPAALRVFGYGTDELIGRNVRILMPEPYRSAHDGYLARYRRTGERRIIGIGREVEGLRRDGSTFPLELAVSESRIGTRRVFTGLVRDISERRQAEAALRESEARFRDFATAASDWFWESDARHRFTWFSSNVEDLAGLPPEWHYGKTRLELMGPGTDPAVRGAHRRQLEAHEPFSNVEYVRPGPAGDVWLTASGVPVFGEGGRFLGYRGIGSNITGRKKAEAALASSEARYRALFEHSNDAILVADFDTGRYVDCNGRAVELSGYSREELLSATMGQFASDRERACGLIAELRERGSVHAQVDMVTKDGRKLIVDASARVVRLPDQTRVKIVVRDVTEQKRATLQRELLLRELRHRVSNMLAAVQVLAHHSAAGADSLGAFLEVFRGRLHALAAAHGALMDNPQSASLRELAATLLAPHIGTSPRIDLDLDEVALSPEVAQSLALVLHELATNAGKYGALSVGGGQVRLTGRIGPGEDGPELSLIWSEHEGPTVVEPEHHGFGTRLLRQAIAHQHGGHVQLDWRPEGLVCRLVVPLGEGSGGP